MPRKSKKKTRRVILRLRLRNVLLLFVGFCIPFVAYVFYLDQQVREKFEGRRFSLPARVFSRPLELYEGKRLSASQLSFELKLLNYQQRVSPTKPGEYAYSQGQFTIFTRSFTFWDGQQAPKHISFSLQNDVIVSLKNEQESEALSLIRLDPVQIGGIYPNQGQDRELVRLSQVPQSLIDCLIATEDKRFYHHHGVDPKALVRAVVSIFTQERIQGGSTITQQLVKNFYLTQERTLRRKVKEIVMALLLELHYGKEDILETYINEVYFGQDRNRAIHGFGLASQFYFGQSVEHLSIEQSALLVGLLKGPAYYNPRRHPDRAKVRRDTVLMLASEQGKISQSAYRQALALPISISAQAFRGQTPYPAFLQLVLRQLKRDYRESDLRSEGLRIFTTLDVFEQDVAERVLKNNLANMEKTFGFARDHLQGAAVLVGVFDGEIKALVGDRKPEFPGFNRALNASRQVGSLIKPAIYLTALESEHSYNLNTALNDEEFIWREPGTDDWRPLNYDKKFHGEVPLWLALARSYNVAAARLGTELGVENIMGTVQRLGVRKTLPRYASGLLGSVNLTPLQVAQMYHTIASGGFRTPFRAIREVTSLSGEPLKRYPLAIERVVEPQPNFLITAGLQEVVRRGTAKNLNQHVEASMNMAGKTGTTDDLRDSWFAGFSGNNVAVVWVGNDNNQSVGLTGATGALEIWGQLMAQIDNQPLQPMMPDNLVAIPVDRETGFIAVDNCHNTFLLPFSAETLPYDRKFCGGKKRGGVKSWFRGLFQ